MVNMTKKMIAETFLMLVKKKNLQKISVSEIVEAAGISRGTFYNHFVDIQDLINWIFHHEVTLPFREAMNSADETPSDLSLIYVKALYQRRGFYCQAFRTEGSGTLCDFARAEILENWMLYFKKLSAKNPAYVSEDIKQITPVIEMIALGSFNSLVEWARKGMLTTPEQVSHDMDKTILPFMRKLIPDN